jgi:hypothetical protein
MSRVKYLSLIQAIVLLRDQNLSKRRNQYKNCDILEFEITRENIDLAYELVHEILGKIRLSSKETESIHKAPECYSEADDG